MNLLSLLASPSILYSIIAILASSTGGLLLKSCSSQTELTSLQYKYSQLQGENSRLLTNQAVIQSEIAKQAKELDLYNSLASRYKKELQYKYSVNTPPAPSCNFDFTFANSLLQKQGVHK